MTKLSQKGWQKMGGRGGSGGAGNKMSAYARYYADHPLMDFGDSIEVKDFHGIMAPDNAIRLNWASGEKIIIVSPVTTGASEKQINYANSVKRNTIKFVQEYMEANSLGPKVNLYAMQDVRNRLFKKINAETDAKTILNNIKDLNFRGLLNYYNVMPKSAESYPPNPKKWAKKIKEANKK